MRPGKKNHEAVASRQLAPTHMTAPDYDLLTSWENQQKIAGSTAGITRIGIKSTRELRPRNCAGVSTTRSIMSYLLNRCQKSNWCCHKKFGIVHRHGNGRQVALGVENVRYDVI